MFGTGEFDSELRFGNDGEYNRSEGLTEFGKTTFSDSDCVRECLLAIS